MDGSPLAPPLNASATSSLFLEHFRITRAAPPEQLLPDLARAFSRIPYENLTKIIKAAQEGSPERARRGPHEVIQDHIDSGAGGTCFALTAALLHILRGLGWRCEPILADRCYGADTHCALIVWINGVAHLLDPGYLIVHPVSLAGDGETRLKTSFNEVILTPRERGEKVDLITVQHGVHMHRLTFKTTPADAGEFLKAWDASFGWDMMRYPLLTTVAGASQLYLQGNRFQVRGNDSVTRNEIDPAQLVSLIAREFGINAALVAKAVDLLKRKGEMRVEAGTS